MGGFGGRLGRRGEGERGGYESLVRNLIRDVCRFDIRSMDC